MPLLVECPRGCQVRMSRNRAGRIVRCPECKCAMRIPKLTEQQLLMGDVIPCRGKIAHRRRLDPAETERRQVEAELAEKELAEKALAEKELAEKALAEKEFAEKELADKELAEKELVKKELIKNELVKKELVKKELVKKELVKKELAEKELAKAQLPPQKTALTETAAEPKLEEPDQVEGNEGSKAVVERLEVPKLKPSRPSVIKSKSPAPAPGPSHSTFEDSPVNQPAESAISDSAAESYLLGDESQAESQTIQQSIVPPVNIADSRTEAIELTAVLAGPARLQIPDPKPHLRSVNIQVQSASRLPPVISLTDPIPVEEEKNWEERLTRANSDRKVLARFFALCLCLVALVNMVPAIYHWYHWTQLADSAPLPRWIYIQIFVGAMHLIYAVFLAQIPDWSAMRSVSVALLLMAFVFGTVSTGLLVGGQGNLAGFLGIPFALNRQASIWCVAMLCLATLMSYWGGKESANWQRAEHLLKGILAKTPV